MSQVDPSPSWPARVRLLGMPIDPVTAPQAIARILSGLQHGRGGWVITPNLDQLRLYSHRPELRAMYEQAELILADGMPLLWAARVQRTPLPARVAGSELIDTLTQAAAGAARSVYLLGGNPGAAQAAGDVFLRRYPALCLAGTHCPPFGFEKDPAQLAEMIQKLQHTRPDIVFVGLGFPKQERLIEQLRPHLPRAWFLGVGVSFSFVAGQIRQAPHWMRRLGLEWIHRMFQEPGRLFRRYMIEDLPFAVSLFARVLGSAGKSRG